MANTDAPRGYYNARCETGGSPRIGAYKNTAAIIYPGDLVKIDSAGRVLSITDAADNPFGVAASYVSAVAGQTVYVYDDLDNTTFEVQVDDNSITDDTQVGSTFDTTVTSGNTTTHQSTMELDGDAEAQETLWLYSMITRPDNDDSAANNKVRVKVRVSQSAEVRTTT